MKNQIEEMAKDLQETHDYEGCDAWHCGGCKYEKYNGNYLCESIMQAERLTAKGYRKASEVARDIFEEIEKTIASLKYRANTPRKTVKVEELKEQVNWVLHEVVPKTLAELKKKYIGEDTNVTTNTEGGK